LKEAIAFDKENGYIPFFVSLHLNTQKRFLY
jgi:hypothetical protein